MAVKMLTVALWVGMLFSVAGIYHNYLHSKYESEEWQRTGTCTHGNEHTVAFCVMTYEGNRFLRLLVPTYTTIWCHNPEHHKPNKRLQCVIT